MIDTLYFDNWNTLVQAPDLMRKGSSTSRFHRYLASEGVDISLEEFRAAYRPITDRQVKQADNQGFKEFDYKHRLRMVFDALNLPDSERLTEEAWSSYIDEWPRQTEFFPGVPAMLEELGESYKLGVITNYMDGPTCRAVFDKLGFEQYFDSLVVSAELGYRKPAPVLFETALRETSSKASGSVMVGDTFEADVVGGNLAGMRTVLVDIYDNQQANYHMATAVIKQITDFPDALEKLTA